MNQSIVIGNLGADAEVVENNGQKFITLSIADSRKYRKQDGSEVTQTNWVDAIINNPDHPILPYLKQGVKVCVIGNTSLRVYSSKKDRMMKAGMTIHVNTIELCGGSSESVPRQLIDPDNGMVFDVQKYYWVNRDNKSMKKGESYVLVDTKGNQYSMSKGGFVVPLQEQNQENAGEGQGMTESNNG